MKRIAIIVGSKSDLPQCLPGLELLKRKEGEILVQVYVRSQHRNTSSLQQLLRELPGLVDVVIAGAGWANHLTGCVDAYLRHELRNTSLPVIGVAFEDETSPIHTRAAVLSMTEVPGTQVIYEDQFGIFVGQAGFSRACQMAISDNLPAIELPKPKEALDLDIEEAINLASKYE